MKPTPGELRTAMVFLADKFHQHHLSKLLYMANDEKIMRLGNVPTMAHERTAARIVGRNFQPTPAGRVALASAMMEDNKCNT